MGFKCIPKLSRVTVIGYSQGKFHPRIGRGEWRYSCTHSLTSALVVVGGRHAPAALPPGRTRCPLYKSLGGP